MGCLDQFIINMINISCKTHQDDKKSVILQAREGAGMFSVLDDVLSVVISYEDNIFQHVEVDFEKTGVYYEKKFGDNWWRYYFEPIRLGNEVYPKDKIMGVSTKKPKYHIESGFLSRKELNQYITKYIRIKSDIQSKIDKVIKESFAGKYIIAVHYRGTDKKSEAPRTKYDKVLGAIKEQIEKLDQDYRIFIATDEQGFLDYSKKQFPDRVIYYEHATRSKDSTPVHLNKKNSPYSNGEEAIIDALLLSKGNILIRTSSNLSRWSTYFNHKIPVIELSQRH